MNLGHSLTVELGAQHPEAGLCVLAHVDAVVLVLVVPRAVVVLVGQLLFRVQPLGSGEGSDYHCH